MLIQMPRLPRSYWLLPLVAGIPSIYIVMCRGMFETTAKLTYLGSGRNALKMLFFQVAQLCLMSVAHYWLYRLLVARLKLPSLPLGVLFFTLYFELFGFAIYDFEFTRINMQMVLPSIFTTYAGRLGGQVDVWAKPVSMIVSRQKSEGASMQIVVDSIIDQPVFWIVTTVVVLAWVALLLFMLVKYWQLVVISADFAVGNFSLRWNRMDQEKAARMVCEPKHPYKNFPFIFTHVMAAVSVMSLIDTLLIPSDFKMRKLSIVPYFESLFLALTHYEKHLSKDSQKDLLRTTRHYLPPGRKWLDNRADPTYPAVHGDMAAFCAYNKGHQDCRDFKPKEQKPLTKLPNVIVIMYESLTPSHTLITKEFIREQAEMIPFAKQAFITKTPYYNSELMSYCQKYQKYALTFSGASSLGIPTASGFMSINTGILPAQTFNMIIDGAMIHSDDIASLMRQHGYRTLIVEGPEFSFDGQPRWVYKRPAVEEAKIRLNCRETQEEIMADPLHKKLLELEPDPRTINLKSCSKEEIDILAAKMKKQGLDVPQWYDYAVNYYPIPKMAHLVNLSAETIRNNTAWPCDRLTAAQLTTHWKQQKDIMRRKGDNRPLFTFLTSVDSHTPYKPYDKEEYYDPIRPEIYSNAELLREARFNRANKATDRYTVGYVLDWLKENDPNTIFVMTGDHGTRDIPIREQDSPIVDNVVYSSDCVHHSSGTDSFFVVSGMIGYLGDDPIIRQMMGLDKLAGQTVKVPVDHSDLIFTVEDIIARLNGSSVPPTHRRSRNVVDLALNISNTFDKDGPQAVIDSINNEGWRSVSLTSFNTEYREGISVLRSHPADPDGAHFYEQGSFPACLRLSDRPPMKLGTPEAKEMYNRMFRFISTESYLAYHNRMYHYDLRNETCIAEGSCKWPEPHGLVFNDHFFISLVAKIPFYTTLLVGGIFELVLVAFTYWFKRQEAVVPDDQEIPNSESQDLCLGLTEKSDSSHRYSDDGQEAF